MLFDGYDTEALIEEKKKGESTRVHNTAMLEDCPACKTHFRTLIEE